MLNRRRFVGSVLPFAAPSATCLVLRIVDHKILLVENEDVAARALLPPASTLKPFSLLGLIEAGKLNDADGVLCTRRLSIAGHELNCIHPPTAAPMNAARAIAYSCNQAVAHFAARYVRDELPRNLIRYGFTSQTGLLKDQEAEGMVARNTSAATCQLQALGEEGIRVTPMELLLAYARLGTMLGNNRFEPILRGLEGAVEFGTAQAAQVRNVRGAGKTGSIVSTSGWPVAWFAGFAPSRAPKIAVVVLAQGHSGGADAAPLAARLLEKYVAAA